MFERVVPGYTSKIFVWQKLTRTPFIPFVTTKLLTVVVGICCKFRGWLKNSYNFWKLQWKLLCLTKLSKIRLKFCYLCKGLKFPEFPSPSIIAPKEYRQSILCTWKFQGNVYFIILSESFPGLHSTLPVHWQELKWTQERSLFFSSDYDCF